MAGFSPQGRRGAPQVLVLGSDVRSFLGVIRSLGRRGAEVHVGWCELDELATRSRYVSRVHDLPAPTAENAAPEHTGDVRADEWLVPLRELCQAQRFDLVVPTNVPATVALHQERGRLDLSAPVYLLNERAFEVTFDKRATSALARELGLPVPDEVLIEADATVDGDALFARLGAPVVLKPRRSFAFGRLKWEHQVRKARNAREVETSLRALVVAGDVLAQRNVPGVGVGVEVLAEGGELRLVFQHRRLHEPLEGGGSSYRRSEALDPELLEATRKLCRALDYSGVGMFEFKRDAATGGWWLIEINGRFWGSLPLALASGVDFPWALFEQCRGGDALPAPDYESGVTCRNLSMDWPWLWRNLRADRSDPELATVGLGQLAGEALRVLGLRDHYDSFALDDRAPAWAELRGIARDLARILMKKTSRLPYRLPLLRSLLTAGLRRRSAEASRLLFVCKGNICRSSFAEHYARRVLPGHFELASSGTYPYADRRAPAEAIEAARGFEVDLARHRSRVLTEDDVRRADLVLVFDEANLHRVGRDFPAAQDKLFRLGALCPGGSVDLRDPYGGDLATFEGVYGEIAAAIDVVAELVAARAPDALEEPGS